jgi:hypothetical protein
MRSKIYRWYEDLHELDLKILSDKKDDLKDALEQLEKLRLEVQGHTKVPLSYRGEYYDLISHIDLVRILTEKKLQAIN